MRTPRFSADALVALLREQTVATLSELMAALGTRSRRTAFRKLKEIPHRTSYSHRGGYYTLDECADFDEQGLWSFGTVRFSAAGTLLATAAFAVRQSEAGLFGEEADNRLQVGAQDALRKLVRDGRLTREKLNGRFLYCAADPARRAGQARARRLLLAAPGLARPLPQPELLPDELRAALVLFASLLDERQRRLFAGLESLKCGWGGDTRIAALLGIDPATVARGRRQLVERDIVAGRARRPGGGRKAAEKKTPEILARIEALMAAETAGDPMTGLKWTRRTTARVAAELRALGIDVCPRTVARLLKTLGFALRVNHKKRAGASHPDRDAQFRHIAKLRERCAAENLPLVSVDTKKKELVGNFKNPGAKWDRTPQLVRDHDFRSEAEGIAIPYGVYDPQANTGTVFVGSSFDTPAFAVDRIEKWWRTEGRRRYPSATRLHILADSGGSNSCTARAWKFFLKCRVCDRHGLTVTVAHYPAAASKWNPIEHRLFCEISKNWAGRPLADYPTVLKYLRTTTTATGLRVRAHRVRRAYKKGVRISDSQMLELNLSRDNELPKWNYTLSPS